MSNISLFEDEPTDVISLWMRKQVLDDLLGASEFSYNPDDPQQDLDLIRLILEEAVNFRKNDVLKHVLLLTDQPDRDDPDSGVNFLYKEIIAGILKRSGEMGNFKAINILKKFNFLENYDLELDKRTKDELTIYNTKMERQDLLISDSIVESRSRGTGIGKMSIFGRGRGRGRLGYSGRSRGRITSGLPPRPEEEEISDPEGIEREEVQRPVRRGRGITRPSRHPASSALSSDSE